MEKQERRFICGGDWGIVSMNRTNLKLPQQPITQRSLDHDPQSDNPSFTSKAQSTYEKTPQTGHIGEGRLPTTVSHTHTKKQNNDRQTGPPPPETSLIMYACLVAKLLVGHEDDHVGEHCPASRVTFGSLNKKTRIPGQEHKGHGEGRKTAVT